jgi:hypothetical protein
MVEMDVELDVEVDEAGQGDATPTGPAFSRRSLLMTAGFAGAGALAVGAVSAVPGLGGLVDGALRSGTGAATSFGSVALLRGERSARLASGAAPGNHTWGEIVALQMVVRNETDGEVLVSPGQLRLRVGRRGRTVTPHHSSHGPTAVAAGQHERIWVAFLAPVAVTRLAAEFEDPWLEAPVAIGLPVVVRGRAGQGGHHG